MCALPACCEEEKKKKCPQDASALLFIFHPPIIFYMTCHLSTCHFCCLQNFVSIYSPPVSPSQAASLSAVLLPCCHSLPTAAGRWLSLKSETAVCDCGWPRVTRWEGGGLRAELALVNAQPHHLNGFPPPPAGSELPADWLLSEPMGGGSSQRARWIYSPGCQYYVG